METSTELPLAERLELNELLKKELLALMNSTDIQVDCYELVYDEFFDQTRVAAHQDPDNEETIDPEYEKRVSAHLGIQWEKWRERFGILLCRKSN